MKLNLLPTHVAKEGAARGAWFGGILAFLVLAGISVFLYTASAKDFEESKKDIPEWRGKAVKAKETADAADTLMNSAKSVGLLRNTNLAKAMLEHNKVYPDLYDRVQKFIPSFYRVNSMSAQSAGAGMASVTLVGVLDTPQQYADLMLALLRMPELTAVSRSGFTNNAMYVPAPTVVDQSGKPRKPGDAPIPDNPIDRLDYFIGKGRVSGYDAAGGFGSGQPGTRGAMPNSSLVTVTLTLKADLQTPDPKATLALGTGGQSASGGSGPGATSGNLPSTPPVTPPTTPPASGPKRGKKGASSSDDE